MPVNQVDWLTQEIVVVYSFMRLLEAALKRPNGKVPCLGQATTERSSFKSDFKINDYFSLTNARFC